MVMMVVFVVRRRQHTVRGIAALSLLLACGHQSVEIEFVRIPFAMHLCHYILVVVIPVHWEEKYMLHRPHGQLRRTLLTRSSRFHSHAKYFTFFNNVSFSKPFFLSRSLHCSPIISVSVKFTMRISYIKHTHPAANQREFSTDESQTHFTKYFRCVQPVFQQSIDPTHMKGMNENAVSAQPREEFVYRWPSWWFECVMTAAIERIPWHWLFVNRHS